MNRGGEHCQNQDSQDLRIFRIREGAAALRPGHPKIAKILILAHASSWQTRRLSVSQRSIMHVRGACGDTGGKLQGLVLPLERVLDDLRAYSRTGHRRYLTGWVNLTMLVQEKEATTISCNKYNPI
jgi:hypothetical protein